MITIEYCGSGKAIADELAERFVQNLVEDWGDSGRDRGGIVSTENVIQAALTMVVRDGIEVQFKYKDKILTPNEYGALHDWPKGFCDTTHMSITERMTLAMKKRKAEKINDKH